MISIPWYAWYGDTNLHLTFPDEWAAQSYWPDDAPDLADDALEAAFDNPIGAPPIEELAQQCLSNGSCIVSISVDDISRPTPASRIMPILLRRLTTVGIDLNNVRVVMAVGMHRPMLKDGIVKKIGQYAADRLDVYNNYPYQNFTDFGVSEAGTPIKVCRFFGEADLKIGIGSITPHGGPGFGGGAKIVFPGVSSFETVSSMHKPHRHKGGLLKVDDNDLRCDMEDMASKAGLNFIVNTVPNSRRQIAGVFAGDFIKAHRAGVHYAMKVFATDLPAAPVDIAVCNAYPKDTDFLQAGLGLTILHSELLNSAPQQIVKENGTIVIISASPEGRGHHALYGPGMIYGRRSIEWQNDPLLWRGRQIIHFSPNITPKDARNPLTYNTWQKVITYLKTKYRNPSVAIFPCGSIQLSRTR